MISLSTFLFDLLGISSILTVMSGFAGLVCLSVNWEPLRMCIKRCEKLWHRSLKERGTILMSAYCVCCSIDQDNAEDALESSSVAGFFLRDY